MIYSKEGLLNDKFELLNDIDAASLKEELEEASRRNNTGVFNKPKGDIYFTIIPDDTYSMLRRMGNSNLAIKQWSKKLVKAMMIGALASFLLGILLNKLMLIGVIVIPILLLYTKMSGIKAQFNQWQFERRIQFSKFCRLLIPYLKQASSGVSLFTIFGKVAERLDSEQDRNLLNTLRKEMVDNPNDLQVFINYAEQASGTDSAVLFMSILFDIRQGASDQSIVNELGAMATAELMNGLEQIIEFKSKKFLMFPTRITMMQMILVIGFGVAIAFYTIKETGVIEMFKEGI